MEYKLALGAYHSCAVLETGLVKCWGANYFGQLRDGSLLERNTPVTVLDLPENIVSVSTGGPTTCVLTDVGGVKCWGANTRGQLGNGTTVNSATPVDVIGLSSGVKTIAVGGEHACALTTNGGVKCWGGNNYGQIGDGILLDQYTPVDVEGLASEVIEIASAGFHSCAVLSEGTVKCWGLNREGQLGDGTTLQQNTPVNVIGFSEPVIQLAVSGGDHTCALTQIGSVFCWGLNAYGQLGDGTYTNHLSPVEVQGLSGKITDITAGHLSSCAIDDLGQLFCWGVNGNGQLGIGTTTGSNLPVQVTDLLTNTIDVAGGSGHYCALLIGENVKCWGTNNFGQLGDGTAVAEQHSPVDVVNLK